MVRGRKIVGGVCLFFFFFFCSAATAITGKEIMEMQKERHKVKSEVANEIMILVDKSGNKEKRKVKRYAKEVGNDLHRYLIVFLDPADIKGTALLTWEQKGRENDQWLYLPACKKMQRIARGSKKNYFMGTDFTYEDLEPEDIDNFHYKILREEKFRNHNCYVIEAVPATKQKKRESGYSKRIMWIEKQNLTTLKIEFYDRRGRLQKTQTNYDLVNVGGTVWRANKLLMVNHQRKHKTLIGVTFRQINVNLDDSVFTERFIVSGKYIQ